ncbi:hypothetical protein ACFLVM_00790 [Chloroflexota bacterium]
MKNRVKWFLLVVLVTMLFVSFPACNLVSGISTPSTTLNSQTAMQIIVYQAVPYIDHYLKEAGQSALNQPVSGVGNWNANFEGNGIWRVEGQVLVQYPSGGKNCSTAWTLSEVDGAIKLVKFVCE